MITISARKLLQASPETVWDNLRGEFKLAFDDGVIETNHKETAYSRLFWELINHYPKAPLLIKHHYKTVNTEGILTAKTHLKMFDSVVWDIYDIYKNEGVTVDQLIKLVYELNNNLIYNFISSKLPAFMSSLDAVDFIEILNDPAVAESQKDLPDEPKNTNRLRNQKIIDDVTNTLKSVFKENRYPDNALSKLTRAKLVRADQVYQGLGVRGYLTDSGSDIFPYPIMAGFFRGMNKFHDVLIESRSASKSLFSSKTPLQDTEYFSRRLQLLCQSVKNLHPGDCGSTSYLNIRLRPESRYPDGSIERKSDLGIFLGKYYLDEESNELKVITSADKHLIGKKLKIRSAFAGCNHPDPYGVCSVCFGKMSENIPPNTNLGQATSTAMTQKSSQLVLSVKHYDGSSVIEHINIDPLYQKYIAVSDDNNSYKLNGDFLSDKTVKLIIRQKEAKGLPDVMDVDDVTSLTISRISEMPEFGIRFSHWKGDTEIIENEAIPVCMGKRQSSMSHELLAYVKKQGWTTDDRQNFIIDLADWNYDDPVMVLPFRHLNMADHAAAISNIIESKIGDKGRNNSTPEAVLMHLSDVVNSKLDINIAIMEIIMLASLIVSESDGDFRMPKPGTKRSLGVLDVTIPNRSLGAAMAYEDHKNFLTSPSSFFNKGRASHPLDVLLMPKEVIDHLNQQKSNW